MNQAREQVSVKINPGSQTATEINPIPERKSEREIFSGVIEKIRSKISSQLRKFEIDYTGFGENNRKSIQLGGYLEGSILEAEVLENGKIRIL